MARLIAFLLALVLCSVPLMAQVDLATNFDAVPLQAREISFRSFRPGYQDYRIRVVHRSGIEGRTSIFVQFGGQPTRSVSLANLEYPDLAIDEMTPSYREQLRYDHVIFRISFGNERPTCFTNYDGRDYVEVNFRRSERGRINTVSFSGCEARSNPRPQ